MEKTKKQLAVQYTEEDGWSLSQDALNTHIKEHFDELRQHALSAQDISNKKLLVVIAVIAGIATVVSTLALAGASFYAFIIAIISVFEVNALFRFLDKK
jgi:asparagine N-glycosylation enzyme membrane subunit Stt3